jgi:hypothetical protein
MRYTTLLIISLLLASPSFAADSDDEKCKQKVSTEEVTKEITEYSFDNAKSLVVFIEEKAPGVAEDFLIAEKIKHLIESVGALLCVLACIWGILIKIEDTENSCIPFPFKVIFKVAAFVFIFFAVAIFSKSINTVLVAHFAPSYYLFEILSDKIN